MILYLSYYVQPSLLTSSRFPFFSVVVVFVWLHPLLTVVMNPWVEKKQKKTRGHWDRRAV